MEATATREFTAYPRLPRARKPHNELARTKPFLSTASLPETWCTSPSAIHRGRLRLVHTKSLLNFLERDGHLQYRIKSGCEPFSTVPSKRMSWKSEVGAAVGAACGGSGPSESKCNAYYTGGGSRLGVAIRCQSEISNIEFRSKLSESGGRITGTWEERTYNAEGTASGQATNGNINLTISGGVTGSMLVSFGASRQSVSISTQRDCAQRCVDRSNQKLARLHDFPDTLIVLASKPRSKGLGAFRRGLMSAFCHSGFERARRTSANGGEADIAHNGPAPRA